MFKLNNVRRTALCVALLCAAPMTASAFDMTLDGFGSAYYGQAYNNATQPVGFSNNSVDFSDFSLVGLNLNSKIDENWSFAGQLVAKDSSTNANLFANWAYVQYAMNGWDLRAGRQAFNVFSTSEHFYEHSGVPFRTTPQIVFDVAPFDAFDGVTLGKSMDMGAGKLQVNVFGGNPKNNGENSNTANGQDLFGANANMTGDGWLVHASASRVTANQFVQVLGNAQAHEQVYSAGYRFDKMNFVSWGEYVYTHSSDGTAFPAAGGSYAQSGKAGYVLVGYHFGDWTPRYTFAQASVNNIVAAETTTHTIGVNYQVSPKVVAKAEFEIDKGSGSTALFEDAGSSSNNGTAGYVGVDFVF